MKNKHSYSIEINGGSKKGKSGKYTFRNIKDITIIIGKQKATVLIVTGVEKTIGDFTELKWNVFKDSLRRMYLLHAFTWDEGIVINSMKITIDDEVFTLDQSTRGFPFVVSMFADKKLNLNQAWKNENIFNYYLTKSKSESENDYCNCAAQAFLASKNRSYDPDRFSNLWTAMNAYYTNIGDKFEKEIISEEGRVINKYKVKKIDNPSLGALICSEIKGDCYIPKKPDDRNEFKNLYNKTNDLLINLVTDGIEELYNLSSACLDNNISTESPYYPLFEAVSTITIPVFAYLLVMYPYYLRCNYFHGSKVQPYIFSFNDPELVDLQTVNFFLEKYLNQKIPTMFTDNPMSIEQVRIIKAYLDWRDRQ